jgi:hypothetical protein
VFLLWFAFVRRKSSPEKLQRAKKFPIALKQASGTRLGELCSHNDFCGKGTQIGAGWQIIAVTNA